MYAPKKALLRLMGMSLVSQVFIKQSIRNRLHKLDEKSGITEAKLSHFILRGTRILMPNLMAIHPIVVIPKPQISTVMVVLEETSRDR